MQLKRVDNSLEIRSPERVSKPCALKGSALARTLVCFKEARLHNPEIKDFRNIVQMQNYLP
jgi:hypothetical protein